MQYESYPHRFADIILNSDYELKKEVEGVIRTIEYDTVLKRFEKLNEKRQAEGKKLAIGKQSTINTLFREEFGRNEWEIEKNVFNDPDNDLVIDFWKRNVGIDVAFAHRSFIGGDLLRLQAAAEVKDIIKVGIYICPIKTFAKEVSPRDGSSMVTYERTRWYLDNFYPVFTVPILLIGLIG
ncbi:MAG: restriction endonuclease [Anaerolineales bacterium]|nr:restriction endonuclease [Anaerolineales bacterium]